MSYIIYQHKEDIAYAMLAKLVAFSQAKKEAVHIGLSGGSTPKAIFELIAKENRNIEINWQKLHFWWCDERCVSAEDKESNFGEAKRLLFQHVDIPKENLHPMQGALFPDQAALNYVQYLKKNLVLKEMACANNSPKCASVSNQCHTHTDNSHLAMGGNIVPTKEIVPKFDWLWLGMGGDGHTASLFVNGVSLGSDKWVEVAVHPVTKQSRITLTLKVINQAREIDFLVTGESKANMLCKIFDRETMTVDYPAKAVSLKEGKLLWHIDQSAASGLMWQE